MFASQNKSVLAGYQFWDGTPPTPTIYTDAVMVTPHGGTAPYTYAWAEVDRSGDGYTYPSGVSAVSASAATTNFKASDTGSYSKIGWFQCTVTDAAALTFACPQVEATVEQST